MAAEQQEQHLAADTTAPARRIIDFYESQGETRRLGIPVPVIESPNYVIPPSLVMYVKNNAFHGRSDESPQRHLEDFDRLCRTVQVAGVPHEALLMMLFPFSLRGEAELWGYRIKSHLVDSWPKIQSEFLKKYFPKEKTIEIRYAISNFQQERDETLYDAWTRMKGYLKLCPHHGMSTEGVLSLFYMGAQSYVKGALDIASKIGFANLDIREGERLVENLALSSRYYEQEDDTTNEEDGYKDPMTAAFEQKGSMEKGIARTEQVCTIDRLREDVEEVYQDTMYSQDLSQGTREKRPDRPTKISVHSTYAQENEKLDNQEKSEPSSRLRSESKRMLGNMAAGMERYVQRINNLDRRLNDSTKGLEKKEHDIIQKAFDVGSKSTGLPGQPRPNPKEPLGTAKIRSNNRIAKEIVREEPTLEPDEQNSYTAFTIDLTIVRAAPEPPDDFSEDCKVVGHADPSKGERLEPTKRPKPPDITDRPQKDFPENTPHTFVPSQKSVDSEKSEKDVKPVTPRKKMAPDKGKGLEKIKPEKVADPGTFSLPCTISSVTFPNCCVDLGASVSVLPLALAKRLGLTNIQETNVMLVMADQSEKKAAGCIENLPVIVGDDVIPIDFMVLDMESEPNNPIILGRPFLATAGAVIDVRSGKIDLHLGGRKLEFPLEKFVKKPTVKQKTSEKDKERFTEKDEEPPNQQSRRFRMKDQDGTVVSRGIKPNPEPPDKNQTRSASGTRIQDILTTLDGIKGGSGIRNTFQQMLDMMSDSEREDLINALQLPFDAGPEIDHNFPRKNYDPGPSSA